jgi:hypothetical protein
MWQALAAEEQVPRTSVRSPDGRADNWSQQHMTFPALRHADPDTLRAAVACLVHAGTGAGYDRRPALVGAGPGRAERSSEELISRPGRNGDQAPSTSG